MDPTAPRITAIVPTYNRRALFARAVESVFSQTFLPARFVILNNGSTDGTSEYLSALRDAPNRRAGMELDIINSPINSGASAGMRFLLENAMSQTPKPDWIWVMDDDAMAAPTALEELIKAQEASDPETYILESTIVDDDGIWTEANRPAIFKPDSFEFQGLPADACQRGNPLAVNTGGYCGMLVRRQAFEEFGYPRSEFYLWYDDIEFVMRVSSRKKAFLVPRSRIVHSAQALVPHRKRWPFNGPLPEIPKALLWRYYYLNRNWLWMAKQWLPPHRYAFFWSKHMARNLAAPLLLGQTDLGNRWALAARAGVDALLNRLGPQVSPPSSPAKNQPLKP